MNVLDRIKTNEKAHTCLTSAETEIGENLVRYNDDRLPDMYDNNFFEAKRQIIEEDYARMSYVHSRFDCPMFLHADKDDTPKDMYRSMGFFAVKTVYEYLRTD